MGDEGSAAMKAALAAAGEGPVRPKKKEKEKEEMPWKVSDFQGKYHTHAIKNAYPIPGSMIEYEAKRVAFIAADREARASRLRHIRDGFDERVKFASRHANTQLKVDLDSRVNVPIMRVEAALQALEEDDGDGMGADAAEEEELEERKATAISQKKWRKQKALEEGGDVGAGEEEEEDLFTKMAEAEEAEKAKFWTFVDEKDHFNMEKMLRTGFTKIDCQEERYGFTALMRAAATGDVEMVRLLLQNGANPSVKNNIADSAIHQAWRFWDPHHVLHRRSHVLIEERDAALANEDRTVEILLALLRYNADPNATRSDGSICLHEAVRRGPIKAVKMLLQFRSDHDTEDHQHWTPVMIAERSGNKELARLLHSWGGPIGLKTQYEESEYIDEWGQFTDDPSRTQKKGNSAERTLSSIELKTHQAALDYRVRKQSQGGIDTLDEVLTAWRAADVDVYKEQQFYERIAKKKIEDAAALDGAKGARDAADKLLKPDSDFA